MSQPISSQRFWILVTAGILLACTIGFAEPPPFNEPLTLEAALQLAHQTNARLPVARLDVEMAQHAQAEIRARQKLRLLIDGDVIYSPPNSYDTALTDSGEERLQLAAERTLLDGGARAAERKLAATRIALAGARYHQAERDVDLEVRLRFATILATDAEQRARDQTIARLQAYLNLLSDRQRSGQPVSADLLRTQVQLQANEAARIELEGAATRQRMALNVLVGRGPETALDLAPLPEPVSPEGTEGTPWRQAPEVEIARQRGLSAAAELDSARAAGKPQLSARADVGLWGSDTTHLTPGDLGSGASFGDRLNRDAGYSISFNFSWPIDVLNALKEKIATAQLGVEQAEREQAVQELSAHLQYAQARQAMTAAFRRFRVLSNARPTARDAYLEIESRYRGGAATAQEVLAAASAELDASVAAIQAEQTYYEARALVQRWGSP